MPYLSFGLILVFFFLVQMLLCFKTKHRIVQLLPSFLALLGAVYGFSVKLGVFGKTGWNDLVSTVIFLHVAVAFLAILAALLFHWSMRRNQKIDL